MMDIINNDFIIKDAKDAILVVMCKLIQIDIIPRFRIGQASKNPYFVEAVKYNQTFIEIFQTQAKYHLIDKITEANSTD